MILKKLVIHNLASIPDATIDFEAAPLSNSDVYLISGEVGSGKSTILDAICLALYGDTPRFKRAKNTSKEDVEEDVKAYSPKQILRRGTNECYAQLTFIGNNGTTYEAKWGASRPRTKLSDYHKLNNLDTGIEISKKTDVAEEIAIAVGLDFDQFCRTTMLAQGEFTRFLAGNDNDKADILEKITDSGIFAEIGKKIFENFRKKEDSYKQIRRDIDAIPVMSDDELNTAKTQLAELSEKVKTFAAKKKKVEEKRNWLVDDKGIADKVAEATLKLAEAQAKAESDSINEAA
ncbi:MAG: SMC family ATPase, partial [Muribaculaceae bacterium]|nr:SMC family ATPase [Muribaculaceae bacterium]